MTRLLTIPFSHYCEKARWALDHVGIAYVEDRRLPGAHARLARRRGGRTVPILTTDGDGGGTRALTDSTDILAWADTKAPPGRALYPRDAAERRDVEALAASFDEALGPATRLLAYHYGLREPSRLVRVVAPSLGRLERLLLRPLLRVVGPVIQRGYRIDERSAAEAERTALRLFDLASSRLESAPYLGGATFGAADLTFAALASPVLLPPGCPIYASSPELAPPPLAAIVTRLRATPAGAHALRMYREHRRR